MKVVFVSSELAPWCKTGGLGDVIGALPAALEQVSGGAVQPISFLPLYRRVRERAAKEGIALRDTGVVAESWLGGYTLQARILRPEQEGPPVYFVDHPGLYDRDGIYDGETGPFSDNAYRFAFLCLAALSASPRLMGGPPDIFHGHDWQAGLLPVYLRRRFRGRLPNARSVFTIHNLAYQGVFGARHLQGLGLDPSLMTMDTMEFHGAMSFMKGGISDADAVTTVSPSYAREICTPEFGCGLEGFLRHAPRRLLGIVNGADTSVWDPETDPHLTSTYSAGALMGKGECRAALLREFGLEAPLGQPVLGVVSRFTGQKGLDLIADLAPELPRLGARLVILGTGQPSLERRFADLARRFPRHIGARIAFSEPLAHKIYAGSDMILVPSRFEPCGLSQIYAMRYGAVPVVHAVGGLRDTVRDPGDHDLSMGGGTGFSFQHPTVEGLRWALGRAIGMYRHHPEGWGRILRAGMARDGSWDQSARDYATLYQQVLG